MKASGQKENTARTAYWSLEGEELLLAARGMEGGLSAEEASGRLQELGPNAISPRKHRTALHMLLGQFKNPLVLILIFAAVVSAAVSEWVDTFIVLAIVLASALLSFTQEYMASRAVARLRDQVRLTCTALRDGRQISLPAEELVPGDFVLLSAGSLVPADGIVLECKDFFVSQAVMTGETFPVEKAPGAVAAAAGLAERHNMVFMGTSVRSGSAKVLVVTTGARTEFGQIADKLSRAPEMTEFERGTRKFGYLLSQVMLALVAAIFVVNTLLHKPVIDSLLFAIALAVGLTPELLPAIISISLSRGARDMARSGVIVRRLNAIENLGSMDLLCTDKTGTITRGVVQLDSALDAQGQPARAVSRWAALNARLQTGIVNALDEAILAADRSDTAGVSKLDEIPYDFFRKRLSVVVEERQAGGALMITKGALDKVLEVCVSVRQGADILPLDEARRAAIQALFSGWSAKGFRVLGLAVKEVPGKAAYTAKEDETGLHFAGFLLFFDPPKEDAGPTIRRLADLGVQVKIITGDNRLVARHVAGTLGLDEASVLPAEEIARLSSDAFAQVAERTSIFAEVDPNQKEQIILALKKRGHVVGYMGDGINDAPALHAADIGVSVDSAVDVAKEAADFVLLRQDLSVLLAGIREGRRTFANTLKYIYTTTSANFGNMISMAGASLFLPFLPLLAKQILLNNFLSDFPAAGIPGDRVDEELLQSPQRWNVKAIRAFMIVFGLVSSLFDFATFFLLLVVARAGEARFQTGWFVESLLSELAIALVVRTRRVFFRSRPGRLLWVITLAVAILTLLLPYLPFAGALGFTPLPFWLMAMLAGITALYVLVTELVKRMYFKKFTN